jgi:hypothetical protein
MDIEAPAYLDPKSHNYGDKTTQLPSAQLLPTTTYYCRFHSNTLILNMDAGNLFFTGDLVHIMGTNIDCRGCSCRQHEPHLCGSALRVDNWVIFRLV